MARDVEFPMALQLHKPVLFWTQTNLTPSETKAFNERCRKLQMLIKRDVNPNPISYEEKLAAFLSSSLVGSGLAERVRASFDTYLFLSYRKKDREYVLPLLETIHQYDCFRDTAVWYDEFLTIGENFSTAIEAAMKKSSLVVLLVTPNILESDNYVKDYEYRDACRLPRPVIPVMAEETDPEILKKEFDGLADCIALEDAERLAQSIRKRLTFKDELSSPNSKERKEHSLEHDYLIGLAYLNGIDVEVNTARGIALITSAAEQGYDEALERLAGMYFNGNGVSRDCEEAVRWQKRMVEVRQKAYKEEPTEINGIRLARAQQFLGNYLYELRNIPEAKDAYLGMLKTGEAMKAAFGSVWVMQILTAAGAMLGDISCSEGRLLEAADYLNRSWEQSWQQLQRRDADSMNILIDYTMYSHICFCVERLGSICEAKGDLAGAREYYQRLIEINTEFVKTVQDEQSRRSLAVSIEKLGDICLTEGKMEEARAYYTESTALFRRNMTEYQTADASACYAVSLTKMGDVCRANGDLRDAKAYYLQGLTLQNKMPEHLLTMEERVKLTTSCNLLGLTCLKLKETEEARLYLERSLEISRCLVQEAETQENLQLLSICCSRLGDFCEWEGNLSEAKKLYLEDLELSQRLAEQYPTIVNIRNLALGYDRLGNLAIRQMNIEASKYYYLQGVEINRYTAEKLNVPETWHLLAAGYFNLGIVSEGDEREDYGMQAYEIWDRLLKDDPWNHTYLTCRDRVLEQLM